MESEKTIVVQIVLRVSADQLDKTVDEMLNSISLTGLVESVKLISVH
jgi:hypothetical protein